MIKKASQVIKAYFSFSKSERKGITLLCIILIIVLFLPTIYGFIFPPEPPLISMAELPSMVAADESVISDETVEHTRKGAHLFYFDPNKATDQQLLELGMSEKNVRTIRRYQAKGGTYKTPAHFLRMYGLKDELKNRLEPYIRIESGPTNAPFDSIPRVAKRATVVELNTADSASLVALYRIGPGLTRRIIEYREKLGGFVSISQLTELWGFDPDILYDLDGKITLDPSKARIFDLNKVSVEELKTHPYFKHKLSNAIVNYRMQHGHFGSLADLKKIVLINDSIYQKITLYLRIN